MITINNSVINTTATAPPRALMAVGSNVALAVTNEQDNVWYLNSSAMPPCMHGSLITTLQNQSILLGYNSTIPVLGIGTVEAVHYMHKKPELHQCPQS
jgi:hypothetical protein